MILVEAPSAAPALARERLQPAPEPFEPPSPSSQTFEALDRALQAGIGRITHGISPIVLARACVDWLVHLGLSPGKQAQLVEKATRKALRLAIYAARAAANPATPACIQPLPQDHRFDHPDWRRPPFNLIEQSFLLTQQWWHNATTGLHGMPQQEQDVLAFAGRQLLDLLALSNFVLTNPLVLRTTVEHGGANLVGRAQLRRGLRARARGQAAARRRAVGGRRDRGAHPQQGGLPQPADRADPVRAPPASRCSPSRS
jgi:polyhydroxyalkanoate synthase